MKKRILIFSLFIAISFIETFPQDSTIQNYRNDLHGDLSFYREGLLDGNKVRTLFNNIGEIAHWPYRPSGEWPKGTGYSYLDGLTFLIGAEITSGLTKFHTMETYYREWVDKDPETGNLWTLAPVPGYFNKLKSTPALNNNPSSWPYKWPSALNLSDDWNGHWYGYFGKDNFYPALESFYVMDDSKDKEFARHPYNYFPIDADSSRGGLGLRIEVRTFQWNGFLEDIIFIHHDVYNISDYDYEKVLFGFYVDPGVGGTNDSQDDMVDYNKEKDLVYFFDSDGISIYWDESGIPSEFNTGYLGITYLDTPDDIGLAGLSSYRLGDGGVGGGWPKDDESLWNKLANNSFDISVNNSNISVVMGTGTFQLDRAIQGKYDRLASALIFGTDKGEILFNKELAQKMYDSDYAIADSLNEITDFDVKIITPSDENILTGNYDITWQVTGNAGRTTTYLYYTDYNKYGIWYPIGIDSLNANKFTWDTKKIPDGVYYIIRSISISENGIGIDESDVFSINNTGKPQIVILSPVESEILKETYNIRIITGGTSDSTAEISLFYKANPNRNWELVAGNLKPIESYEWFTWDFANTNQGTLLGMFATDTDTSQYTVENISINNSRPYYTGDEYIYSRRATGTGSIEINVTTQREVTGDNYLLVFKEDETTKDTVYDVINLSTSNKVVNSAPEIYEYLEGPYFEGIRLRIKNNLSYAVIDSLTGWQNSNSNLIISIAKDTTYRKINFPADYKLEFYETVQDTSFIEAPTLLFRKIPVYFKTLNITNGYANKIATKDNDRSNSFTVGDEIQILEFAGAQTVNNSRIVWIIHYDPPPIGNVIEPLPGDAFIIKTEKPFLPGDSLFFSTDKLTGVNHIHDLNPGNFHLFQNYPNPFNPETIISYQLPVNSNIDLRVFDILGKEIITLAKGDKAAGIHKVLWNGKNSSGIQVSSGIYICRINAASSLSGETFIQSIKLLMLK